MTSFPVAKATSIELPNRRRYGGNLVSWSNLEEGRLCEGSWNFSSDYRKDHTHLPNAQVSNAAEQSRNGGSIIRAGYQNFQAADTLPTFEEESVRRRKDPTGNHSGISPQKLPC